MGGGGGVWWREGGVGRKRGVLMCGGGVLMGWGVGVGGLCLGLTGRLWMVQDGFSALILAAQEGHVEVADRLIAAKCKVCLLYTSPSPRD